VEELLRRARPLPPHEEMVIEDLAEEEGLAFYEPLTRERRRGPIVINSDGFSADLVPKSRFQLPTPRSSPATGRRARSRSPRSSATGPSAEVGAKQPSGCSGRKVAASTLSSHAGRRAERLSVKQGKVSAKSVRFG